MAARCYVCGKEIEEERADICDVCEEAIRAEALGKQRQVAKDALRGRGEQTLRRQSSKEQQGVAPTPDDVGGKKPHHFRSMAEYLRYLKKKGGAT